MAFCGKCGTQLSREKFCPNCGAPTGLEQSQVPVIAASSSPKKSKTRKKMILGIVIAVAAICTITHFATATVNEPCDWCGKSPSVAYKMSDGSYAYICKDCSEICALCSRNKATKHYENLLGTMTFVCDDCYNNIRQEHQ